MRRCSPAAVSAAAAALLLTGCTGADAPERADTPAPTGPAASQPALAVPRAAEVLLPETSGTAGEQLPRFTPPEEAYTLYADCTGTGTVTIVDRSAGGGRHLVRCNGVTTVGVVHTPGRPSTWRSR